MEKNSNNDDDFIVAPLPVDQEGRLSPEANGPMMDSPAPVPERTPENFICLRDCRHYWTIETMLQAQNSEEFWEDAGLKMPNKHHHVCLINPGAETEFADDNCYSCNKWDPIPEEELVQLKFRRDQYYEKHPECMPIEEDEIVLDIADAEQQEEEQRDKEELLAATKQKELSINNDNGDDHA